MLIQFINKLSLVSKGINLELDNRLAKLRSLLNKSAPISEIESKILEISKLLQRHATTNEQNIINLHEQFNNAGQSLKEISTIPDDLRQQLAILLKETSSTKSSIIQYIPFLNKLIELYGIALRSQQDIPDKNQSSEENIQKTQNNNHYISTELIEQISVCLSKLHLSKQHTQELLAINTKLANDTKSDDILQHFIEIFDVIVADYQNERESAKSFLKTLNKNLNTRSISSSKKH